APTAATPIRASRMASSVRSERTGVREIAMNTVAAHQRVMRPVPHTTSGAGLAVIASLLLELAGASMAAPPPDRRASRPLVFEANRGQADAQVQVVARGAGYTAFL